MSKQDTVQSKAFIDKARELEVDESGRKFERVFKKIVPRKKRKREDKPTGQSDRSEERAS